MQKLAALFFFVFILSSCVKDKPVPAEAAAVEFSSGKKVFVINEGPFGGNGNGSISLYDPQTNEVVENYYQVQNKAEIGNIAQSMNYISGSYYIVVNNANKIIVCNDQLKKTAEIKGLTSPRYILALTNKKAYVSDLYANAISIVDLATNAKTGSIACYGKTEKMVSYYNKVFVTNTDREYVYVIDALQDAITDSVYVGWNAASVVMDKNDKIWVVGSGKTSVSPGRLTRFNPATNSIEANFIFAPGTLPGSLCLNKSKDLLFYLEEGIHKMSITDASLPSQVFIPKETKNFYGLGVNPNDGSIYAADALDYSQRSQIYVYNPDGSVKTDFKAGVIANGFYFE
ncbi:hypothetical protein CNR22_05050 [Sphingobacteriaceae bacterium]|nr:hypothetical protein CNR22_05050 [Sphingobacteriaceae bacterium]